MNDKSGIITGQYVRIEQATASVGDRIFAQLIDWLIMLSYIAVTTWILVETNADGGVAATILFLPLLFIHDSQDLCVQK